MTLLPGTRLGAYEVVSLLGAGGMGEVYRARDTKLKRDVAIKVLPDALAAEPERIARFEREAELLASLNHPHIATVHDFQEADRRHFLVMELVEGQTLADRLKQGPLPLEEALDVVRQTAEALEAAHERGVIHRDLKPGNIKIAPDGNVKVLDFGLAKMFVNSASALDMSHSPTMMGVTAGSVILGTAAYMSPEQARGRAVDKRADIWALGCVMYELLTGRQAFAGDNVSDTIAAVLRGEPDWSALPSTTPHRVRTLVERCLRKDPRQRVHDAGDVRIEIEDASAGGNEVAVVPPPPSASRLVPLALGLAVGLAVAATVWWLRGGPSNVQPQPVHLSASLAAGTESTAGAFSFPFVISPDGKCIVYTVTRSGKTQLVLRAIQEFEGKVIGGTEGATNPFFSPDSEWIGFGAGKELKKVSVTGGLPTVICSCVSGFIDGAWGTDNTIVFVPDWNLGIWTVSADGGKAKILLKTDESKDRIAYNRVQVLPDARGILFTIAGGQTLKADEEKIAVLEPGATEPRVIVQSGSGGRYLANGHLVYALGGALLSVAFDLPRLAITGTPATVLEGMEQSWSGESTFSISQNGTLIYEPAAGIEQGRRFALVDRKGTVQPITERIGTPAEFSVSPDGKHIVARLTAINDDLWTFDVATGTALRFTSEPLDELSPRWTPDGARIAYATRTGQIFWKPADGSGPRELLSQGEYPRQLGSFSPDGKTLAFSETHPTRRSDIWLMTVDDHKSRSFLATDADEWAPMFSPNGRWLAYVSDETGRDEIYVRPIGSAGGRKRVSTEGGTRPIWNRKGSELFFLKGDKLASVMLDAEANPVGRDHVVLDAPRLGDLAFQENTPSYDVMPDGDHFVMVLSERYPPATRYNVVLNWFEELKKR